jgi:hypothetical protein
MSELIYSKKQLQPLVDKYAINTETNTVFTRIIKMFEGQPNYQLWGVKVVFSKAVKIEELETVKDWIDNNQNLIKMLSKNGNIICYTTEEDFKTLRMEMDGLYRIAFVKSMISIFNTDQRKILGSELNLKEINGLNFVSNVKFNDWYKLLDKFNKLSANTKANVIKRLSAERNVSRIKNLLTESLKEKYAWNKTDLLAFVSNNTPKSEVVYIDRILLS